MLRDEILRLKPAWRRKPAHPPLCSRRPMCRDGAG